MQKLVKQRVLFSWPIVKTVPIKYTAM